MFVGGYNYGILDFDGNHGQDAQNLASGWIGIQIVVIKHAIQEFYDGAIERFLIKGSSLVSSCICQRMALD